MEVAAEGVAVLAEVMLLLIVPLPAAMHDILEITSEQLSSLPSSEID